MIKYFRFIIRVMEFSLSTTGVSIFCFLSKKFFTEKNFVYDIQKILYIMEFLNRWVIEH